MSKIVALNWRHRLAIRSREDSNRAEMGAEEARNGRDRFVVWWLYDIQAGERGGANSHSLLLSEIVSAQAQPSKASRPNSHLPIYRASTAVASRIESREQR